MEFFSIEDLDKSDPYHHEKVEQKKLELMQESISRGYEHSLKFYANKYELVIKGLNKDKILLYDFVNIILDVITFYLCTMQN